MTDHPNMLDTRQRYENRRHIFVDITVNGDDLETNDLLDRAMAALQDDLSNHNAMLATDTAPADFISWTISDQLSTLRHIAQRALDDDEPF